PRAARARGPFAHWSGKHWGRPTLGLASSLARIAILHAPRRAGWHRNPCEEPATREESQRRSPRRGPADSAAGARRLALVLAARLLHGGLHLLEGAYLDLADPLARDAELGG